MAKAPEALDMALDDMINKGGRKTRKGKGKGREGSTDEKPKPHAKASEEKTKEESAKVLDKMEMSLDDIMGSDEKAKGKGKKRKGDGKGKDKETENGKGGRRRSDESWKGQGKGKKGEGKNDWSSTKWDDSAQQSWKSKGDSWGSSRRSNQSDWSSGGNDSWSKRKTHAGGSWDSPRNDSGRDSWKDNGKESWSNGDRGSNGWGNKRPSSDHWDADQDDRSSWKGRGADDVDKRRRTETQPRGKSSLCNTVKVSNIPLDLNWRDIKDAFEAEAGKVVRCELSNGTGFLTFESVKDAQRAVDTFDRGDLNGRTIEVRFDPS